MQVLASRYSYMPQSSIKLSNEDLVLSPILNSCCIWYSLHSASRIYLTALRVIAPLLSTIVLVAVCKPGYSTLLRTDFYK